MASSYFNGAVSSTETVFVSEDSFPLRLRLLRWVGKQTWMPRGQDQVLRKIWSPDTGEHFYFEVDFYGLRYRGDLASFIDWSVFAYRSYSYCELCLLDSLSKEIRTQRGSMHFFDVGANVGQHSLFMAPRADCVYSFEPMTSICGAIEDKVKHNHLSNVSIIPSALGASNTVLEFYPAKADNAGIGTFVPENAGDYRDPISLQIRRGDDLLDELGCPSVDLLKVDVEGFEDQVFGGLCRHIQKDRPCVLSELSDRSRESLGSEKGLRNLFWDGAILADVSGRQGCSFQLKEFRFDQTREMLIVPPEMQAFVQSRMVH